MLRAIRWTLPALLVVGLIVALTPTHAHADAAATNVVITVSNADGSAAANAEIKVYKAGEEPQHQKGGDAAAPTTAPTPVATSAAGADGKASLTLPAGDYTVMASLKGVGRGKASLTVKDGENDVTVTLKAHKKPAAAN